MKIIEFHEKLNHPEILELQEIVQPLYPQKNIFARVKKIVEKCDVCQKEKIFGKK